MLHVFELFPKLGTPWSANSVAQLLKDQATPEEVLSQSLPLLRHYLHETQIQDLITSNIPLIIPEATSGSIDTLISSVTNKLSASTSASSSLHDTALYLAKNYSSDFFPSLFSSSRVGRGSLKWLANSYAQLKSEILTENSPSEKDLTNCLAAATSQLSQTVNQAIAALDTLGALRATLGMFSDLLKVPGEAGLIILEAALNSRQVLENGVASSVAGSSIGHSHRIDAAPAAEDGSLASPLTPTTNNAQERPHSAPTTPLKRDFEGSQDSPESKRGRYDQEIEGPRGPRGNLRLPPLRGNYNGHVSSGSYRGGYQGRNYIPGYRGRGSNTGGYRSSGNVGGNVGGGGSGGDYYRSRNPRTRYPSRGSDYPSRSFYE